MQSTEQPPVWRTVWPGALLILLGAAGFFGLLDAVTEQDDLFVVDSPVLEWLAENRTPAMTDVMTFVTNAFGPLVLPIVVLAVSLLYAWRTGSWWDPAVLTGAMILASGLSVVLKLLVGRPRPPDEYMSVPGFETSFSFPSGHTIGASTLVLVAGYLIWHRRHGGVRLALWAVASVVIIGLVGGSRLYLGYHFVTDVLAGICVSVVVLGVVVIVTRLHDRAQAADVSPPDPGQPGPR
ncbi:phosphatase PAP2 family protein [Paraoerskovia marina]|uniref:phosphatase PAP2 family protein n=1 Tax=Paraoerskovia marina TaxID=545619 RepID=UPI000492D2D8|nr:phosphatase PAP2 family protein [Paraoerskovia marina]